MNHFKKAVLSAVLAVCGATNAYADTPPPPPPPIYYVPMDTGAPGQFTNNWSFDDSVTGTHVKNQIFDDLFSFNVPDSENISITVKGGSGVSWSGGGGLWLYILADGTLLGQASKTGTGTLNGGAWNLTSGTYVFEISGTYTADGASYSSQITGTPALPVPEPSSVLMLLAGMGVLTVAARRRSSNNKS